MTFACRSFGLSGFAAAIAAGSLVAPASAQILDQRPVAARFFVPGLATEVNYFLPEYAATGTANREPWVQMINGTTQFQADLSGAAEINVDADVTLDFIPPDQVVLTISSDFPQLSPSFAVDVFGLDVVLENVVIESSYTQAAQALVTSPNSFALDILDQSLPEGDNEIELRLEFDEGTVHVPDDLDGDIVFLSLMINSLTENELVSATWPAIDGSPNGPVAVVVLDRPGESSPIGGNVFLGADEYTSPTLSNTNPGATSNLSFEITNIAAAVDRVSAIANSPLGGNGASSSQGIDRAQGNLAVRQFVSSMTMNIEFEPYTESVTDPTPTLVDQGDTVELTAEGFVRPNVTMPAYRWQRDGADIFDGVTSSGSVISGAVTDRLVITNAQPGDTAFYAASFESPAPIGVDQANLTVFYRGVTGSAIVAVRQGTPPPCSLDFTEDGVVDFLDVLEYLDRVSMTLNP